MNTSKPKIKDNIDLICESGFPLQKVIERLFLENNSIFYPHQTEVSLNVPPEYASSKYIPPTLDMVLCQTSLGGSTKWSIDMLVECKKSFFKEWHFFSKQSGSYYYSNKIPISAVIRTVVKDRYEFRIKSIYCNTELFEMEKTPIVCDNISEFQLKNGVCKDSDRNIAYEACGTLSIALFHFLNIGRETGMVLTEKGGNPDDINIVFPILVTTAKLYIVDSTNLNVDLYAGITDRDSVNIKEAD